MKIPKLNYWSMELSDYNLKFIHIKGSNNTLTVAISRLKTLDMTSETMTCIAEVGKTDILTLSTDKLKAKQKEDINCSNLPAQPHHKSKSCFHLVTISACGLLPRQTVHTWSEA